MTAAAHHTDTALPFMRDARLRRFIVMKLESGELPEEPPVRVWGGPATAGRCAVCGEPLALVSAEIEVSSADGRRRTYHPHCYRILADERQRRAAW